MRPGSDLYLGLMSGTSVDGVDAVIVDFGSSPPNVVHSLTLSYPESISARIRALTRADSITINELCGLDVEIAEYYAKVVHQILADAAIPADDIRAIGSHGQTIHHNPDQKPRFTLQIGDPNTLSARSGITTVADFRRRDMALGGQGAPLAPAFHRFAFRSADRNRAIINIGGIANITYLPAANGTVTIGFDTGPGNTLLDYWINLHHKQHFDEAGTWAASGNIDSELLEKMISSEPYFSQKPPKSTGTEYFSPDWLGKFSPGRQKPEDIQATLLELSARTIVMGIRQLDPAPVECYICGGGVHNRALLKRLETLLQPASLQSTAALGVDPDYVEAIAFAWLARQTINGMPGNLPSVTRAQSPAILGGIFRNTGE